MKSDDDYSKLPPEQRLGDQPIEEHLRATMKGLAQGIDEILNGHKKGADRDVGFILMLFPFGDHGGRCNYISNGAGRQDVVTLMKKMIARFEGQPEMEGTA